MLIVPLCGCFCMRDIFMETSDMSVHPLAALALSEHSNIDRQRHLWLPHLGFLFWSNTVALRSGEKAAMRKKKINACKSGNTLLNILNCGCFNLEGSGVPTLCCVARPALSSSAGLACPPG